jgi:hypothetical protein
MTLCWRTIDCQLQNSNFFIEIVLPIHAQQINKGPTQHPPTERWRLGESEGWKGWQWEALVTKPGRKPVKKRCFTRKQSRPNVHKRCFNCTVHMWRWVREMHCFVFFIVHSSSIKLTRYLSLDSLYIAQYVYFVTF